MTTELKQTKNSFKFIGKVTRIDKDGAYKQEEMTKGKMEGKTYRSLRFGVKTSETNDMTVQMFDFEPEEVFLWNSDKRKANSNYKGEKVAFDKWFKNQDKYRDGGYAVLQTRIGLTYDADEKLVSKGLPSFVASKDVYNNLDNGDYVAVEGDMRYSEYTNKDGKVIPQTNFTIKKVHRIKALDFLAEDFEEITFFEQEMVFVDADLVKEDKKVYVTGRTIDYKKNFHDSQFVVDYSDGNGGTDAGMVKLADAFVKKIQFGDVINVFGDAVNRVIVAEVEGEEEEQDDLYASLGGKAKPSHSQPFTAKTYINEMQITGIDAWDKKVYKEEDFVSNDLIEKENDLTDELGGKKKSTKPNPFDIGEDEINEDDLPF